MDAEELASRRVQHDDGLGEFTDIRFLQQNGNGPLMHFHRMMQQQQLGVGNDPGRPPLDRQLLPQRGAGLQRQQAPPVHGPLGWASDDSYDRPSLHPQFDPHIHPTDPRLMTRGFQTGSPGPLSPRDWHHYHRGFTPQMRHASHQVHAYPRHTPTPHCDNPLEDSVDVLIDGRSVDAGHRAATSLFILVVGSGATIMRHLLVRSVPLVALVWEIVLVASVTYSVAWGLQQQNAADAQSETLAEETHSNPLSGSRSGKRRLQLDDGTPTREEPDRGRSVRELQLARQPPESVMPSVRRVSTDSAEEYHSSSKPPLPPTPFPPTPLPTPLPPSVQPAAQQPSDETVLASVSACLSVVAVRAAEPPASDETAPAAPVVDIEKHNALLAEVLKLRVQRDKSGLMHRREMRGEVNEKKKALQEVKKLSDEVKKLQEEKEAMETKLLQMEKMHIRMGGSTLDPETYNSSATSRDDRHDISPAGTEISSSERGGQMEGSRVYSSVGSASSCKENFASQRVADRGGSPLQQKKEPSFYDTPRFMRGHTLTTRSPHELFECSRVLDSGGTFLVGKRVRRDVGSDAYSKCLVRLMNESEILQQLDHPNIIRLLRVMSEDADGDSQQSFTTLAELADQGSVADLITEFGCPGLPETVVTLWVQGVVSGVAYMHGRGIVHRNLRGENIVICSGGRARIIGFCSAMRLREPRHVSDSLPSVPHWTAPEVLRGGMHRKESDVWSVGCTVVEMLTGSPPFSGGSFNKSLNGSKNSPVWTQIRQKQSVLPELPDCSADTHDFITCCLRQEPGERISAERLTLHRWLRNSAHAVLNETLNDSQRSTGRLPPRSPPRMGTLYGFGALGGPALRRVGTPPRISTALPLIRGGVPADSESGAQRASPERSPSRLSQTLPQPDDFPVAGKSDQSSSQTTPQAPSPTPANPSRGDQPRPFSPPFHPSSSARMLKRSARGQTTKSGSEPELEEVAVKVQQQGGVEVSPKQEGRKVSVIPTIMIEQPPPGGGPGSPSSAAATSPTARAVEQKREEPDPTAAGQQPRTVRLPEATANSAQTRALEKQRHPSGDDWGSRYVLAPEIPTFLREDFMQDTVGSTINSVESTQVAKDQNECSWSQSSRTGRAADSQEDGAFPRVPVDRPPRPGMSMRRPRPSDSNSNSGSLRFRQPSYQRTISDADPEEEEEIIEVCDSTLYVALRWLSLHREIRPLAEYLVLSAESDQED
eukprot:TRINITY_DN4298_c0_g1_i1.p1 TRINITY_DN4298_c0_g1~~TRINITY_DN4298_c0_g1_i1.p1  ORF type:complete len:1222 (+),score=227.36 TRINITY_DN4298_c0_g1_i1:51-3716(+)